MRRLTLLALVGVSSLQAEFSWQGHIDLQAQSYLTHPDGKHSYNLTAFGQIEGSYTQDDFETIAKLSVQGDSHDLQGKSDQNDRSFVRLDEFYAKYDFETQQVAFGRNIRFWGALEVDNIVDGFNPDDFRSDLFDPDKLGVLNASYTYYTDSGEIALIAKFNEPDQKMAAYPYVYYFFPPNVSYDAELMTEKSVNRPSVYLKYSGSTDTDYALDYAIILENGYDSQRYFTASAPLTSPAVEFNEHAYLVNKVMSYNTLVVGSTLYKLEALYANVIDDPNISDYYHLGLGIEHTLSQVYKNADLGFIAEYYTYQTLEDDKYSDLDLFETFQNDLFLGLRYSFNEGNDASIVTGTIIDMDYHEQSYFLEYEGRIAETFKLNVDYRYTNPSEDTKTALNLMGRHQRLSLKLGYYF